MQNNIERRTRYQEEPASVSATVSFQSIICDYIIHYFRDAGHFYTCRSVSLSVSVCPSECLSLNCLFMSYFSLCLCLFISFRLCLCVPLSVHRSVSIHYPSLSVFVCALICLCLCLTLSLSLSLLLCMSVNLCLYLSVNCLCLSVFLSPSFPPPFLSLPPSFTFSL